MKKALVSVTNDLSADQRVHRTALTLSGMGYKVVVVGRRLSCSPPLYDRSYHTHRMRLLFSKGAFFYAEYNLRLFFYLLFHPATLLIANDLDTLLPNFLASKIKSVPLVYDSHEYFTGVPELSDRKAIRTVWKLIEKFIFPRLKYVCTVNESIAAIYKKEYHTEVKAIRNVPLLQETAIKSAVETRKSLGLPENKNILILQGAGININRGAEEAVKAMQYLDNAVLVIAGKGDVMGALKKLTGELKLEDRIIFTGLLPFEELRKYTMSADIGLTLDKDTNINYRYSLPNKLFDYIHAGIAVLAYPLAEVKKIITAHRVGAFIENHDPRHIAEKIREMLGNPAQLASWKENAKKSAAGLCWQEEEKKLSELILRATTA